MSLKTKLDEVVIRIATEFKSVRTLVNGNATNLSALNTTAKSNLVAAINEVAAAVGGAGATIDDGAISALTVWSSDKTNAEVQAAIADLIDSAPEAMNTISELADALGDDPNFAATILATLAGKVGTSGAETIGGVKTFSSAPVVPDASFSTAKVSGLDAALAGKVTLPVDPNADRILFWDDSATAIAYLALTGLVITGTTLAVADASATAKGAVELSTDAEAIAGTDTTRAVTPANLLAYVGDPAANFVTTFEAGLL